MDEREMA